MKKWRKGLLAILMMVCLCMTACGATDVSGSGAGKDGMSTEQNAGEGQDSAGQDSANQGSEGQTDSGDKAESESKVAESESKETETVVEDTTPGIKDVFAEYGLKAGTCLSDFMIRDKKSMEIFYKIYKN